MIRVVAVDPGYRNLAYCVLDFQENRLSAVQARHVDLGYCKCQEDVLLKLYSHFEATHPFAGAHHIVIENQQLGQRNTKPRNEGISWSIAMFGLTEAKPDASLTFYQSRTKFATFKNIRLPYVLKESKTKTERRKRIKLNAVHLAKSLLIKHNRRPSLINDNDHIADAVGLGFTHAVKTGIL